MSLVQWHPFNELSDMQRSVNHFFDGWNDANSRQGWFAFPVDIQESPDAIIVRAELPGVQREDIDLRLSGGHLTIRATRAADGTLDPSVRSLRTETRSGDFQRGFDLDMPVDAEHVEARYQDGVLTVHLPKQESVRPKAIPVLAGTTGAKSHNRRLGEPEAR